MGGPEQLHGHAAQDGEMQIKASMRCFFTTTRCAAARGRRECPCVQTAPQSAVQWRTHVPWDPVAPLCPSRPSPPPPHACPGRAPGSPPRSRPSCLVRGPCDPSQARGVHGHGAERLPPSGRPVRPISVKLRGPCGYKHVLSEPETCGGGGIWRARSCNHLLCLGGGSTGICHVLVPPSRPEGAPGCSKDS